MKIAEMTLKQAREAMAEKQDNLGKVFEEAKSEGGYDFNKVKCLGADVKGSSAVAEKVKQMNDELNELGEHADKLADAEKAALEHKNREKAQRGFILPNGGGPRNEEQFRIKSLGELLGECKEFSDWNRSGGIDITFEKAWLSDLMVKAAAGDTLGVKTLMSTSAGYAPQAMRLPGYVEAATRPIQVLDIIPMFQTDQSGVPYMEETTRTHGAAETAEGGDYAESAFVFTERQSPVRKITDSLPVTDEQLADVAMMSGFVSTRLIFGVRQRLDRQVQLGDGSGSNLRGLKNVSGIQQQARGADPMVDTFFKAMVKVRTVGRAMPTHHLIHPNDWQDIRLQRTADGIYIFGSPSDAGPDRLWGLSVVQTDADAEGTGYTGAFDVSTVGLFERQGVEVAVGYVNADFGKGRRTVRADTRAALNWFKPAAFCQNTGL
ncbi:HK97 family phage major capsid protein [Novosphingobium sp. 1748]|uniref:phage major capsid protein n=1 Tax=Novosphingobium sp. 1748 TaxID=2817760 RepID=UPI00286652ED|nr:phage major capsid protein [Novosphingobium sp. 1748]MDR6708161.1 HK97 family phage major capsid protein [Novosphingobium sp. 1748]